MKMDELPSPIIGEIASFLSQKEYALFSRCNRSVFTSSNSPNTLQQLSMFRMSGMDYSHVQLQNYPQIKSLTFLTSKFNTITLPSNTICNRLERIFIDCDDTKFTRFLNQNVINLTR